MGEQDRDGRGADVAPPPPPPPRDENADMTADQKLFWMNALQVSGDWSVHDDGEGRLFYYHRKTDASQWETPDGLAALEGEFMMKLMLQNAVARSGAWTAHDAGNGTLYYFNSKSRASVWERPSEWGQVEEEPAAASTLPSTVQEGALNSREAEGAAAEDLRGGAAEDDDQKVVKKKVKKEKKEKKKKHKKHKTVALTEEGQTEQGVKGDDATTSAPAQELKEEEEEEEPLTPEELQAENHRKARELKRIEQFRAMLRDKSIMPFCKWSVALPQIAGDPRFMGVQTMDERRAIFDHFVEHRREDLKAEKKSKLKQAKQLFAQLLHDRFQDKSWDCSTTLSVFLSTLEDHVDLARYKQVQDDALVFLPMSVQEKIYTKAVAEFKVEALKRDGEELRLTKFLEERLAALDQSKLEEESDEVQRLVTEFYSAGGKETVLLSVAKQQQVLKGLIARMARGRHVERQEQNESYRRSDRSRSRHRSPVRERETASGRSNLRQSTRDRRRSSSHSHRRRSRSRSESRGRERHRSSSRRSRRHRSASGSSRSRSRSPPRSRDRHSSRGSRHHRHRSTSSSSRSRSRTRR